MASGSSSLGLLCPHRSAGRTARQSLAPSGQCLPTLHMECNTEPPGTKSQHWWGLSGSVGCAPESPWAAGSPPPGSTSPPAGLPQTSCVGLHRHGAATPQTRLGTDPGPSSPLSPHEARGHPECQGLPALAMQREHKCPEGRCSHHRARGLLCLGFTEDLWPLRVVFRKA